jgi:dTDP-4-dehydrorhamnose reductase
LNTKPRILLFGCGGQVGRALEKKLMSGHDLIALDKHSDAYCGDFTDLSGLAETIRCVRPNVVINAAAYTAVDLAESKNELVSLINSDAVGVLAEEIKSLNGYLVHYSTDYIFDGSGDHFRNEKEQPNPLSVYGQTKLAGEEKIIGSGCRHLIFRTSWVFSEMENNFMSTILRLAKERDILNIVGDQIGVPTSASLIADVTAQCIEQISGGNESFGIYNLVPEGQTSWCDYAAIIVELAQEFGCSNLLVSEQINKITTADYKTPAKRPLNSRLDTTKLKETFGVELPMWDRDVRTVLAKLIFDSEK